jgi:hypothetical protein
MKLFELKLRLIVALAVMCCLVGIGSQMAQAQTPTSGALLTINGNVGATAVNVSVSDKDIHSGVFRTVPLGVGSPPCTAADQISTDAYVLQDRRPVATRATCLRRAKRTEPPRSAGRDLASRSLPSTPRLLERATPTGPFALTGPPLPILAFSELRITAPLVSLGQ